MNKKTFRDIINSNSGDAVEIIVHADDGLSVIASCWTDDEHLLDTPALFDVSADWEITSYSPVAFIDVIKLHDAIVARFGGEWAYDAADLTFTQC